MSDPASGTGTPRPPARNGRAASSAGVAVEDSFAELRSLLIGPEQRELLELQARLLDPSVQTQTVSRVLPDAFARAASEPRLAQSLAPLIEDGITSSVRRDPRPLADALFPVIGPAIRKAISHALAAMMDSLSTSIEQSVSWRALRWRWTAWKTGKPFGEIVLLNTLQYRVEQVFLIHRETGLLLEHVARKSSGSADVDQVSAMLTAIQDFVRDSFAVGADESLDALRVGELAVIVERGPYAVLAGVVRGTAPLSIRQIFEGTLEAAHRQFGPELRAFHGDASAFAKARPLLEECLVTEFRDSSKGRSRRPWLVAAAVLIVIASAWLVLSVRERRRWNAYLDRLAAEPGIVVVSHERSGGRYLLAGLRDPLAVDPATFLASFGFSPERVAGRWEPYQALDPSFVAARATDLLRPPPAVTVSYRDGLLTASGAAPARWIAESARIAPAIAGVRQFQYTGPDPEAALESQIEAMVFLFERGTASFASDQAAETRRLADLLRELNEAARTRGHRVRIEIHGHTDSDGTAVLNDPLSAARAKALLGLISPGSYDAIEFSVRALGSSQPNIPGATESEKQRNRRASLHVTLPVPGGAQPVRPQ